MSRIEDQGDQLDPYEPHDEHLVVEGDGIPSRDVEIPVRAHRDVFRLVKPIFRCG